MDRVYILKARFDNAYDGYIYKVGKSSGRSSVDRLMQIQRSFFMSHRYTFFCSIIRDRECQDAFTVETRLHKLFKGDNFYHGKKFEGSTEFFKCEEDELLRAYDDLMSLKAKK